MSNLYWDDIASALEAALCSSTIPEGLRPMLIQAIAELRAAKKPEDLCSCQGGVLSEDMECIVHGAFLRGETAERNGCRWKLGMRNALSK